MRVPRTCSHWRSAMFTAALVACAPPLAPIAAVEDGGADAGPAARPLRCDGQRLEVLVEGAWTDAGGCAVDGPSACERVFGTTAVLYHWTPRSERGSACLPLGDHPDLVGTAADDVWALGSLGVWRWDGAWWTRVRDDGTAGARIAIADRGRPWLATARLGLLRFDGNAWLDATPPLFPAQDLVPFFGLAAQTGDRAWVVARAGSTTATARFDGAAWTWARSPSPGWSFGLAVRGEDVWSLRAGEARPPDGMPVFVDRWQDGAFVPATRELVATGIEPSIRAHGSDLWLKGDTLHRWDGTSWSETGGGELFVFDGELHRVTVSYSCFGGPTTSQVDRWDGLRWVPVSDGIGAVISAHPGVSEARSFAADDLWAFEGAGTGC